MLTKIKIFFYLNTMSQQYSQWKINRLKEELRKRNLKLSDRKSELNERFV